jgi:hypothetical protein
MNVQESNGICRWYYDIYENIWMDSESSGSNLIFHVIEWLMYEQLVIILNEIYEIFGTALIKTSTI